jgi:hypothetical protein
MVGFGEVLEELFCFGIGESQNGNGENIVLLSDGLITIVFLGEAADLVHQFFRRGFKDAAHLLKYWCYAIK